MRRMRADEEEDKEEGGREDALGAADSTITPHSVTISTWLLCACLQTRERWITCMSVNAGYCIQSNCLLLCSFVGRNSDLMGSASVRGQKKYSNAFLTYHAKPWCCGKIRSLDDCGPKLVSSGWSWSSCPPSPFLQHPLQGIKSPG